MRAMGEEARWAASWAGGSADVRGGLGGGEGASCGPEEAGWPSGEKRIFLFFSLR